MKRSILFAVIAVTLLLPVRVMASYITMATDFSVTEGPDSLVLEVRTTNEGDEAAYSVQFEVRTGNQTLTSAIVPRLDVNETAASDFSVSGVFDLPGHYPVLVKIHYKDANSYPFTSLAVGFYDFRQSVVSKILIKGEETGIPSNGKGVVKYTVRNNDSVEHDLRLTLHMPDELATLKDVDRLVLGHKQSRTLQYTIENFSALENSKYGIALVAEYDDDKNHFSTAGSSTVRITAPEAVEEYVLWAVAAAVLVLVLLILIGLRRK